MLFVAVFLSAAEPVDLALKSEHFEVKPGDKFWVALQVDIEPGYHFYWKNPGGAGMQPQLKWALPDGFEVTAIEWPVPTKYTVAGIETFGYEKSTTLLAQIATEPKLKPNGDKEIALELNWVVCNEETCLPGSSKEAFKIKLSSETDNPSDAPYFDKVRSKLPVPTKTIESIKNERVINSVVIADGVNAEELVRAEFYPEEQGSVVPKFSLKPRSDGKIEFAFEADTFTDDLDGVLVIGEKGYAIHVDAPQDDAIAIVDTVQPVKYTAAPDEVDSTFAAIGFAFIGGLILNLMPCVLPVVSLKLLSFVKMAGSSRIKIVKHGATFAAGVLVSFWALAIILIALKSYGNAVGWGFQLQSPLFVALFAIIMLVLALNLFGVFEAGMGVASWAGEKQANNRNGLLGSFLSGVLATVVAAPCTGPFLGSALGYAFTRPSYETLAIFTSLGLGMASPYLLISAVPSLARFIPKPGAWMESLKQFMGFMMLFAVLWLTWVFMGQTSDGDTILLLLSFILVSIACWVYGKWATPFNSKMARVTALMVILFALFASYKVVDYAAADKGNQTAQAVSDGWEPFSLERLEELKKSGTPVFVDFTAKWCLICQTNHAVLSTGEVEKQMELKGIVKMKADWTKNDPVITEELRKFGRSGVPLYLLYGNQDNEPKILPQVLTPDILISAIDEI
ncbi:MAG: protein-disulfide reductase DsbD family protein [Parachlamydiaceae bacterium]